MVWRILKHYRSIFQFKGSICVNKKNEEIAVWYSFKLYQTAIYLYYPKIKNYYIL